MKKTKRFVSLIAIFIISILALSCAFLFACGKSDDEDSGSSETVHVHTYGTAEWSDPVEGSDGKYTVTVTYTCTGCDENTAGHTLSSTYTYEVGGSVVVPGTHTHTYGEVDWENPVLSSDGTTYTVIGTMTCTGCENGTEGHTIEVSYSYAAPTSSESGNTGFAHTHTYGEVDWEKPVLSSDGTTYTVTGTMTCDGCGEGTDGHTVDVFYSYPAEDVHTHTYGDIDWGEAVLSDDGTEYTVTGTMTCSGCGEGTDGHTREVSYTYSVPSGSGDSGDGEHTHVYGTPTWVSVDNGDKTYTVTVTWTCTDGACPDPEGSVLSDSFTYNVETGEAETPKESSHVHEFTKISEKDVTWSWDDEDNTDYENCTATAVCDGCRQEVTFVATVESIYAADNAGEAVCETDGKNTYTATVVIGTTTYTTTATETVRIVDHEYQKIEEVPANCTETGLGEYYVCSQCGAYFVEDSETPGTYTQIADTSSLVIPATGHTLEYDETTKAYDSDYCDWDTTNFTFTAQDSNTTVSIQLICPDCGEVIQTVTATITSVATNPSASDNGVGTVTYTASGLVVISSTTDEATGDATSTTDTLIFTYVTSISGSYGHTAPGADSAALVVWGWDDETTWDIDTASGQVSYTVSCATTDHTDTIATGSVSYDTTDSVGATCEEAGYTTYSASVTITLNGNEITYESTWTDIAEATSHTFNDTNAHVQATQDANITCKDGGNVEYYVCDGCGKYFVEETDDDGNKTYVEKAYEDLLIPASDVHTMPTNNELGGTNADQYITWNWDDRVSGIVTATIHCSVCGEAIAVIGGTCEATYGTEGVWEAYCGNNSTITYTATAVLDTYLGGSKISEIVLTATSEYTLYATGDHTFSTASDVIWAVSLDGNTYSATATVVCDVCGDTEEITAVVTVENSGDTTCGSESYTTYIFTATLGGVEYTNTFVIYNGDIAHSLVKVEAVEPTCEEGGNDEYYYCARCGEIFITVESEEGYKAEDIYTADDTTYLKVALDDVTLAPLGHVYPGTNEIKSCVTWTWTEVEDGDGNVTGYTITLEIVCCRETDTEGEVCGTVLYKTGEGTSETYTVSSSNVNVLIASKTIGDYTYTSEYDTSKSVGEENQENDKVHTHEWVATWTWTDATDETTGYEDYACTVVISCSVEGCEEHSETLTATVVRTYTPATCENYSETKWVASVTWNGVTYSTADNDNKQDVEDGQTSITKNGDAYAAHDLQKVEAKAATCKVDGNIEYWQCVVCGRYFSDDSGNEANELQADDLTIAAGHTVPDYSEETKDLFVWTITNTTTVNGTVTIDVKCSVCGEIISEAQISATVTAIDETSNPSSCGVAGYVIYTATYTQQSNQATITATWYEPVAALEHAYPTSDSSTYTNEDGEEQTAVKWTIGTYDSANNAYAVSVEVLCTLCGTSLYNENIVAEYGETTQTYIAVLELGDYEYTFTYTSSTGNTESSEHVHSYSADWSWNPDTENDGYTVGVTITCSEESCTEPGSTGVTINQYDTEGNDTGLITVTVTTDEATCTTAGSVTYVASVEYNGTTFTTEGNDIKVDTIPATGHPDAVYIEALDADCVTKTDGHTDAWYCPDCGCYFASEFDENEQTNVIAKNTDGEEIEITKDNQDEYIISWVHTYSEDSHVTWMWVESEYGLGDFVVVISVYCDLCGELGFTETVTSVTAGTGETDSLDPTCTTEGYQIYYAEITFTTETDGFSEDDGVTFKSTHVQIIPVDPEAHSYSENSVYSFTWGYDAEKGEWVAFFEITCDLCNESDMCDAAVSGEGTLTAALTDTKFNDLSFTDTFIPALYIPDNTTEEDLGELLLSGSEQEGNAVYAEGYDYTITLTYDENGNAVYVLEGNASAMSTGVAEWFIGARAGDAYVVLKIYVPKDYTISYISANGDSKSYTNSNNSNSFTTSGYFFVTVRLTGLDDDGREYVRTSNTYTISGTNTEEKGESWTFTVDFSNLVLPTVMRYIYDFSDEEYRTEISGRFGSGRTSNVISLDDGDFLTAIDDTDQNKFQLPSENEYLQTGSNTQMRSNENSDCLEVDLTQLEDWSAVTITVTFASGTSTGDRTLHLSTGYVYYASSSDSTLSGAYDSVLASVTSSGSSDTVTL